MARRKRRRALLSTANVKALGVVLVGLAGWWDARTKPDPRTDAVAVMATAGAETDIRVAEEIERIKRRLAALERAAPVSVGREKATLAAADTVRPRGWWARLFGRREDR